MLIIQSIGTCVALIWLLGRAWNVLWKPVNDLISILGVEVPDAPEVSLAGIKAHSILLQWSRPGPQKPVVKYFIQVNGVNVGESGKLETAIEVSGLRPGHFYNVRVIAVGPNNFQAGSQVIRLRTLGRDGRPLNNTLAPTNPEDQENNSEDESQGGESHTVGVQATALPETSHSVTRDPSATLPNQRRNTGGRKHSASTVGADQGARDHAISNIPEENMQQLTERFHIIRKETEEVSAQTAKDNEEYQSQVECFMRERDEKKQALKDKEEASERLKKEVNHYERLNRQAQTQKTQKEKLLKSKQSERIKMHEDMRRWKKESQDMRIERENWRKEQEDAEKSKEKEVEELRENIRKFQLSQEALDEEIHAKGIQIKHLEDERKKLPGSEDDEESRKQDASDRQAELEWQVTERDWLNKLNECGQQVSEVVALITQRQARLAALQASSPVIYHANATGVDFEPTGVQHKLKSRSTRSRKSRTSTISSPIAVDRITDSAFPSAAAYNNLNTASPTFAPGPYIDMRNDTAMVPLSEHVSGMSEEEFRALTAGAPLSPTATQLLPSNIFADDDLPSDDDNDDGSFGPIRQDDPQSPNSSSRSASIFSSPQNSSHNLARYGVSGRDYAESDRRSLNSPMTNFGAIGSPVSEQPVVSHNSKLRDLFLPRNRGKTMQEDGPSLGSLKQGQSQSFPRSTDDPETMTTRSRRMSSGWTSFLRGSTAESASQGNAPAPARNVGARSRRGFNVFSNSLDDPTIRSDRDPASPRPLSIASSDLPRPSTDSAPFGWGPPQEVLLNRASPLATNWSIHAPTTWSTNPSRRPSFQHGSSTALNAGIADEDDEFLPPSDSYANQSSPSVSVGVIGTRPPSSHKPVTPKLNPAAPAFSFTFGRSKNDKESQKPKGKGKAVEASATMDGGQDSTYTTSPPASRKSRDTHSIHTQDSMAESYESLDRISSNPASEKAPLSSTSTKEKEPSSFKQLFRKGSSSKFSVTSLRSKEGFFGGKKAGSSTASDRNASAERDGTFEEFGEDTFGRSVESVTSSPMIGSMGSGSEWKGKEKDRDPGTPKEQGKMWSRFSLKKGKARESLDVERSETEFTGTEDEG